MSKNDWKEFIWPFLCFLFLTFTLYMLAKNILLLVHHTEYEAQVVKIERKHGSKGFGYSVITYNYEDDGVLMQAKLTLDETILRYLKGILFRQKYLSGKNYLFTVAQAAIRL